MRGLMEFITARTDTETGSIRYMWHGKDKMDDNKSYEIYTEGRGFPYWGMLFRLFLINILFLFYPSSISSLIFLWKSILFSTSITLINQPFF